MQEIFLFTNFFWWLPLSKWGNGGKRQLLILCFTLDNMYFKRIRDVAVSVPHTRKLANQSSWQYYGHGSTFLQHICAQREAQGVTISEITLQNHEQIQIHTQRQISKGHSRGNTYVRDMQIQGVHLYIESTGYIKRLDSQLYLPQEAFSEDLCPRNCETSKGRPGSHQLRTTAPP